jgi:N-acetylglucosaminyldiphosphoundecaprenol N-acetyl-beta-D-mannosaminyltransferase
VQLPTVTLGPFRLADLDRPGLLEALDRLAVAQPRSVLFSLHVGGLNLRRDEEFVTALSSADIVVADGISVALLGRIAGASGAHRHPTTDAGWELLERAAARLGRPVRVALVGGPEGLAVRAGAVMDERESVELVGAWHGYHEEWGSVLTELRSSRPDVVFVGMGMPIEALWVASHRDALPEGLIVTCGGWFGHIAGDEKRAPAWMRRAGLEWAARLAQQPGGLRRR